MTREFRNAFLLTAAPLSLPVLLVIGFVFGAGPKSLDMLYGAVFADLCLATLAAVTALVLAIARYGRQARGIIAADAMGALAMVAVFIVANLVQP